MAPGIFIRFFRILTGRVCRIRPGGLPALRCLLFLLRLLPVVRSILRLFRAAGRSGAKQPITRSRLITFFMKNLLFFCKNQDPVDHIPITSIPPSRIPVRIHPLTAPMVSPLIK